MTGAWARLAPLFAGVRGLGVITAITALTPWLVMPHVADWGALGFRSVIIVSLIMIGGGSALHAVASLERSTRRAGAAPQVVIMTPRKRRRK